MNRAGFLLLLVVETGPRWLWHLGRFDAGWYLAIIQDGYQATEPALHRRQWSQGRHLSDPARRRSGGSGW